MASVDIHALDGVVHLRVHGAVVLADITQAIERHYPVLAAGKFVWELQDADFSALSAADFRTIAELARDRLAPHPARKVAYVIPKPMDQVRIWQYVNKAVEARVGSEYAVFRDVESALRWLKTP